MVMKMLMFERTKNVQKRRIVSNEWD